MDGGALPTANEVINDAMLDTVLAGLRDATAGLDNEALLRMMTLVLVLTQLAQTDSDHLAQAITIHVTQCTSAKCVCNMPVALRVHREIAAKIADLDAQLLGIAPDKPPVDTLRESQDPSVNTSTVNAATTPDATLTADTEE